MTVLFVGNTPADVGLPSTANSTSATGRDANYSPNSIACAPGAGPAIALPAATGTFWFHFRMLTGTMQITITSILSIYDSNGSLIAEVDKSATGTSVRIRSFGSATVNGSNYALASNTTYFVDIKITVGASGGTIVSELYINGTLVSAATATNSGTVKLQPRSMTTFVSPLTATFVYFSEFIVTEGEDTRNWRLSTLLPASAGSDTAMAGLFSELADYDQATGVSGNANGQRSSWNPSTYAGAASPTGIRGVFLKSQATKTGTSLTKLNQYMKIGGTNYDGSDLVVGTDVLMQEFAVNPATAAAWAVADLSSQFGLKAVT